MFNVEFSMSAQEVDGAKHLRTEPSRENHFHVEFVNRSKNLYFERWQRTNEM